MSSDKISTDLVNNHVVDIDKMSIETLRTLAKGYREYIVWLQGHLTQVAKLADRNTPLINRLETLTKILVAMRDLARWTNLIVWCQAIVFFFGIIGWCIYTIFLGLMR